MSESIRHEGIVLSSEGAEVQVQITQSSACSGCAAKGMCHSAESKNQVIRALAIEPLQSGDVVEVLITQRVGWKAVIWAYTLPFVVLVGTLLGCRYICEDEMIIGVASLVVVGLYYLVLSFFKGRLEKEFSITAKKV